MAEGVIPSIVMPEVAILSQNGTEVETVQPGLVGDPVVDSFAPAVARIIELAAPALVHIIDQVSPIYIKGLEFQERAHSRNVEFQERENEAKRKETSEQRAHEILLATANRAHEVTINIADQADGLKHHEIVATSRTGNQRAAVGIGAGALVVLLIVILAAIYKGNVPEVAEFVKGVLIVVGGAYGMLRGGSSATPKGTKDDP